MKCAGPDCERELAKYEHAQPMWVGKHKYWPKSLCDDCAKKHQWQRGSDDALARLTTGKTDFAELARIEALTPVQLTESVADALSMMKEAA